jgi:hypothetical protein
VFLSRLEIEPVNAIILNDKFESSEPCWDGYQVKRRRERGTQPHGFARLESSILLSQLARHGLDRSVVEMGRAVPRNGPLVPSVVGE